MKHAYLILAHNEYSVLSKLIELLDDERNDIYVHIDKKSPLPSQDILKVNKSRLIVLRERVDVRWGHVSQIEAELILFESAINEKDYEFLHLISGVHLPLYSQDYLHSFFDSKKGKQFFLPMDSEPIQAENKMHRYNFFMKDFGSNNINIQRMWRLLLAMQRMVGIRRNKGNTFIKASNWVSITTKAAQYLVNNKVSILKKYKYTMCGDEFFVPSELNSSNESWDIEFNDRLLLHEIINANAKVYGNEDSGIVLNSNCLFARKFNSSNLEIIKQIENKIISNS